MLRRLAKDAVTRRNSFADPTKGERQGCRINKNLVEINLLTCHTSGLVVAQIRRRVAACRGYRSRVRIPWTPSIRRM